MIAGVRMISGDPGALSTADVPVSTGTAVAIPGEVIRPGPSTTGAPAAVSPTTDPAATASRSGSSTGRVITLTGAGDHGGVPVTLAGGRYEVSYTVSSAAGESCPWALYLAGSNGLDLLMASAYPVDETLHDAESNSFVAAGKATVRVESGCPHWSATISRTGP